MSSVEETKTVEAQENGKAVPDAKETTEEVKPQENTEEVKPQEGNGEAAENGSNGASADKEEKSDEILYKKIVGQVEYYFGNFNLPRDKFLKAEIEKDDGWVPLSVMLKFARLAKLTTDPNDIISALKSEKDTFMEVAEDNTKIRRSPDHALPGDTEGLNEEFVKRTIYCKGFPKDGSCTLDHLLEYFKQFGEYDAVRMRRYTERSTNTSGFKGSVLVTFKTLELATTFIDATHTKYENSYLIKKWFQKYLDEKKKEYEERQAKKANKYTKMETDHKIENMPKGCFLKATGFADDTTREDIKAAVLDLTSDCAFVDFKRGDSEAFIRFTEAGSNQKILAALKDNLKVNSAAITLAIVEGEEEDAQLLKAAEARIKRINSGGNKRRGGPGGRYGGKAKRHRRN